MNLTFAFAVSKAHKLESLHFGDADQFLLFELGENSWDSIGELRNPFKGQHASHHGRPGNGNGHGHDRKADSIITFLQEQGVQILVSQQFGPNIRRVCEHFVPVLVSDASVGEAGKKIADRREAIEAEWRNHPGRHNILRIMDEGVLTIALKKE